MAARRTGRNQALAAAHGCSSRSPRSCLLGRDREGESESESESGAALRGGDESRTFGSIPSDLGEMQARQPA